MADTVKDVRDWKLDVGKIGAKDSVSEAKSINRSKR